MAVVRVREGAGGHERSLVGPAVALPRSDSAAGTHQLALRCRRQVSRHFRSRLHQVLRGHGPAVPNLRRAVPSGESRRTITHMRLLSISRGRTAIEVRTAFSLHVIPSPRRLMDEKCSTHALRGIILRIFISVISCRRAPRCQHLS